MITKERMLLEARLWRTEKENLDKDYFKILSGRSKPSIFWIESFGNVSSVAELTNTDPDEIQVYRNVGGQCKADDLSFTSALESFIGVGADATYVVVCGHTHCPAIRNVIAGTDVGANTSRWMEDVSGLYEQHANELSGLSPRQQERRLGELNVRQQLLNLSTLEAIQRAWSSGHDVHLLGWYLDLYKGDVQEVCSMVSRDLLKEAAGARR